jgi:sugar phosphate isomerase/epimerase
MAIVTSTNIFFERRFEEEIPVATCLKMCAEAGFTQMDFGFAELKLISEHFQTESWEEEILSYKKLADELGISFVQAHATIFDFCNPQINYQEQEELFKRSIKGAKLLGAEWIVVHPSTKVTDGKVDPATREENVKFFKTYAAFAKEVGIGLAIENMWGTTRDGVKQYAIDPYEVLDLIEAVDCDNVRVCWDVEHGSIEKLDQTQAIALLGKYIVATHISDETGTNNIHILPYLGNIDWEELLRAFAKINYSGTMDLEIQHYLPGVPQALIPAYIKLAYESGDYLVKRLEELKKQEVL